MIFSTNQQTSNSNMGSSFCNCWDRYEESDTGSVDMKLRLMYSKHDVEKNGLLTRYQCEMLILGKLRYKNQNS